MPKQQSKINKLSLLIILTKQGSIKFLDEHVYFEGEITTFGELNRELEKLLKKY